jgi:hypothetical protein
MVQVHNYKLWDTRRDKFVTSRLKATVRYIEAIRGEIRLNTAEDVDPSVLDERGRYDPQSIRWPPSLYN